MNIGVLLLIILLIHGIWIYNFIYSVKIEKGLAITLLNFLIAHANAFIVIYLFIYVFPSKPGPVDALFFLFFYVAFGIPYFILHGFFLFRYLRKKKRQQSLE